MALLYWFPLAALGTIAGTIGEETKQVMAYSYLFNARDRW
jgi:hypothetical protein